MPDLTVIDKRNAEGSRVAHFIHATEQRDVNCKLYVELQAGCSWGELDADGCLRLATWLEWWAKKNKREQS